MGQGIQGAKMRPDNRALNKGSMALTIWAKDTGPAPKLTVVAKWPAACRAGHLLDVDEARPTVRDTCGPDVARPATRTSRPHPVGASRPSRERAKDSRPFCCRLYKAIKKIREEDITRSIRTPSLIDVLTVVDNVQCVPDAKVETDLGPVDQVLLPGGLD